MDIKKIRLLARESIYWVNMNANIEKTVNTAPTSLDFQSTQPKDKTMSSKIP